SGELEAELVVDGVGQVRHQAAVDCVRVILLDRIRATTPGVDVEGAAVLSGVRKVVLERSVLRLVDAPIELDERNLRIVGSRNWTEVLGQRATERGGEVVIESGERGARRTGLLLHVVVYLLVVGDEVEKLVPYDRAAQGHAELMLPEVGLERLVQVRCVRRQRSVLSEVVQCAVQVIGAALRDDVDESAARPSELG